MLKEGDMPTPDNLWILGHDVLSSVQKVRDFDGNFVNGF